MWQQKAAVHDTYALTAPPALVVVRCAATRRSLKLLAAHAQAICYTHTGLSPPVHACLCCGQSSCGLPPPCHVALLKPNQLAFLVHTPPKPLQPEFLRPSAPLTALDAMTVLRRHFDGSSHDSYLHRCAGSVAARGRRAAAEPMRVCPIPAHAAGTRWNRGAPWRCCAQARWLPLDASHAQIPAAWIACMLSCFRLGPPA